MANTTDGQSLIGFWILLNFGEDFREMVKEAKESKVDEMRRRKKLQRDFKYTLK